VEVPQQLAVPRVKRLPNLLARRKPKQQQQAAIESTPAESTGFLGLHLDASIVDIGSTAEADKEIERVTNSTSQPAAEGEGWKSPLSIFVG
jgi:hypothetical protein